MLVYVVCPLLRACMRIVTVRASVHNMIVYVFRRPGVRLLVPSLMSAPLQHLSAACVRACVCIPFVRPFIAHMLHFVSLLHVFDRWSAILLASSCSDPS